MSNIRGGRGMRSRGNGNVIRLRPSNSSDRSTISPLMPNTSNVDISTVTSNDGANQQRTVVQPNSGVIRYFFH